MHSCAPTRRWRPGIRRPPAGEVVRTLSAMQEARHAQDIVLDAVLAEPERRAERVTEPRHPDPESEH
jgi:hypothetical protein